MKRRIKSECELRTMMREEAEKLFASRYKMLGLPPDVDEAQKIIRRMRDITEDPWFTEIRKNHHFIFRWRRRLESVITSILVRVVFVLVPLGAALVWAAVNLLDK